MVSKLLAAWTTMAQAEKGHHFHHEIDKIAKKKQTNTGDVMANHAAELLKLLEGSTRWSAVSRSKNAMTPMATVNNRLFCLSARQFPDLEEIC